jgi:hypothetical protein
MKKRNMYKRLIAKTKSICKARRIPKSFSKKNNNVFSNTKHMTIYVLKTKEKKDYRDMPDFLELLKGEIGLKRIPHFTTINKFALRVKPKWFDALMEELLNSVYQEEAVICSIDGTGLSLNSRSKYFETIAGRKNLFMQCNLCYENKHKMILACKLRRKRRNESIDFQPLAKKACERRNVELFLQDKGYDAEKHHKFVRYELKSKMIAPLRRYGGKVGGFYRKQMVKLPKIYKKRASISENGHSILKGSLGDTIYAKKFRTQKIEGLGKILVYDIVKAININYWSLLSTAE